jgi:hypothetical protein
MKTFFAGGEICKQEASSFAPMEPQYLPVCGACSWLLTLVMLYAPLAAWSARSMSCCADGHCPICRHHHQKTQSQEMSCNERDSCVPDNIRPRWHEGKEVTACSLNCCENPEKPALNALTLFFTDAEDRIETRGGQSSHGDFALRRDSTF